MKLEQIIAERKNKKIYREGDNLVKLFNSDFSKSDVLNEALNQARVETTDLKIPRIKEVHTIDGQWAIVSEFIEGKTLAQLMEENPDKYDEYLNLFVDLQLEVLSHSCPLLNKLKDKMHRKISSTTLETHIRFELHTRLDSMPTEDCICHGDFNPTNIIITDKGEKYILDWAHVTQGNAAADAARTYLIYCLAGRQKEGQQYLDLFCKKSGISIQRVQKWMPIVAASQTVKGKPEEKELLHSWVDVVEY